MPTLRQCFDSDFNRYLNVAQTFHGGILPKLVEAVGRVHYAFDANARFVSCYVPETESPVSICSAILANVPTLLQIGDGVEVQAGFMNELMASSKSLGFCGRVFIYTESRLSAEDVESLSREAVAEGLHLHIRGPDYAAEKTSLEKPHAFISHDWRDKEAIARPLAQELSKRMCFVWYDEYTLKLGDPLRESIERGLKECKKCVLILSRHFLSNQGWTKTEFNAVFTREILEKRNLVLPVWCGISKEELFQYSPTLVDRVAVSWEKGVEQVAREIKRAVAE